MATHDISILGRIAPDSSGDVFEEPVENTGLTLGNVDLGNKPVITMLAPTGSDIGFHGGFQIPQNYVGTPVLVIRGYLGEAANILAFGFQQLGRGDSEALNTAFEAEDIASNSTWTGYVAGDYYEETITITPGSAYAAGDVVNFFFYRDNSVDDQTGEFHLEDLIFRYNDT